MEFKDIISISGMPGLYQLVSSKSDGIIVKSLEDGKSQFVSSRLHGVSSLDTIAVFLKNDETTELKKVLRDMMLKETEVPLPDGKSDTKVLKEYFSKILPDYDEEKVHVSDMKKMVKWYGMLKQHELIPAEEAEEKESSEENSPGTSAEASPESIQETSPKTSAEATSETSEEASSGTTEKPAPKAPKEKPGSTKTKDK